MAAGMSHAALADAIGCSARQVDRFEAGLFSPSAGKLYQLAMTFGVHSGYLFENMPAELFAPLQAKATPLERTVDTDSGDSRRRAMVLAGAGHPGSLAAVQQPPRRA